MNSLRTVYGIGIYTKKTFPLNVTPATTNAYSYLVKGKANIYTKNIPPEFQKDSIIPRVNEIDELHKKNCQEKTVIIIPEKEKVTIHLCADLNQEAHHQEIIIVAQKESDVTIYDEHKGNAKLHTHFTEIYAKERSCVTHIQVQKTKDTQHYIKKAAHIEKKAQVIWQEIILHPAHIRTRTVSNLEQEEAKTQIKPLYLGKKEQEYDIKATVNHNAPRTESYMRARGVLKDKAKTILRGLINIKAGIVECTGIQEEHTLLLSPKAKINAVPNLEIANNNVQCSHSSAITTLDEKKLFYAMTRGLNRKQAEDEIVTGFLQSTLQNIQEDIKEEIRSKIQA